MTDEAEAAADRESAVAPGVGEELARARQALGLSVADIAQQLKFAPRQIEALEAGRFEDLPAGTFARGMVRAYARIVKLDPVPLVGRMASRVAVPDNAQAVASVRRPIPITDSSRRGNLIYVALSLVFVGVIAGVVFEWQRERSAPARLSFVDAAQAPTATATAPVPPVPIEPQRAAMASTAMSSIGEAPADARPATVEPAPPAAGRRRLQLRFERESWVEIRGRDGKVLTSELNPGGTERVVEGLPPFTLIIGNAQHVKLSYDERPVELAPHVKVEVARFTLD